MATALHRTTLEIETSVHTPDYDPAAYVINPDLSPVLSIARKYWKLTGDVLSEMSQAEKDAADASELAAAKTARKATIDRQTAILVEANEQANGTADTSKTYIDDGRTLKTSIDGAANQAALDAIADTRT